MSKSKVVSGTVMSVESVITTFRNKDAYNALSEKVDLILTLDNNRTYQIDSPPEGIQIRSKVNLYCYKEGNAVLINKTSSKYIKRERFWNVLSNCSVCIGSGISSFLLLIDLIIFSKRDGLNYAILSVFIFSLIITTAFCFVFLKKDADKAVHPEDLKKIDALLEKNIENNPFISTQEIQKVKSAHKEKVDV